MIYESLFANKNGQQHTSKTPAQKRAKRKKVMEKKQHKKHNYQLLHNVLIFDTGSFFAPAYSFTLITRGRTDNFARSSKTNV